MSRKPRPARLREPRSGGLVLFLLGAVTAAYLGVLASKWAGATPPSVADLLPISYCFAASAAVGLVFLIVRFRPEPRLLFPALFLYGTGVAVQFRFGLSGSGLDAVSRYAGVIGLSVCVLTAIAFRGDLGRRLLRATAPLCYLAAVGVLAAMAALGHHFRGGVFLEGGMNPTEIVKVLLVVALAPYLATRRKALSATVAGLPCPAWRVAVPLGLLWLIPMLELAYLRDFGMLVLCSGAFGVMLYAASERKGYLVVGLFFAIGVTAAGYRLTPHIATRVTAWWTPFRDPTGAGWQTLQSLSALYAGGMWGSGLGAGSPQFIPVASTDFVYAVIGEELGFTGCALLVALFLVLLRGAFDVAKRQRDDSSRLLATGLAAMLALQMLLNLGGVTKAIPVTGVPLPFVSHGGSSLVTSFLALGLLLAAAAEPTARKPATVARRKGRRPAAGREARRASG